MNPFGSLPQSNAQKPVDRIPGFEFPPTDIYDFTIKVAFMQDTKSGGKQITYVMTDAQGKEVTHTVYPTSKKSGTEKPTYTDKDGNEQLLAGYIIADDIAVVATGKSLNTLATSNIVMKLMDRTVKQKVDTPVIAFPEMQDRKVSLAIQRCVENKTRLNDSTKKYEPTAETRQVQELVKVLDENHFTVNEAANGMEQPEWSVAWLKSFKGKDRDKTVAVGNGAKPGLPTQESSTGTSDITFDE